MKKTLMTVTACGLLGSLILAGTTWSQAPTGSPAPVAAPPAVKDTQTRFVQAQPNFVNRTLFVGQPPSEIGQLMSQLREATDDAKKTELTKKLETAVDKHFDEDLKNRETELTKLEERLTKLRAQLDRRRKAKAEILQLQIKVMVNEAEGLGFSGASAIEGTGTFGLSYGEPNGFPGPGAGGGFPVPQGAVTRPIYTAPPAK